MNKHHIYPRSRVYWEEIHWKNNIIRLPENYHTALHKMFHNKTPIEQIKHLMSINLNALQKDFNEDILNLLDERDWYEMKNWIYIKN